MYTAPSIPQKELLNNSEIGQFLYKKYKVIWVEHIKIKDFISDDNLIHCGILLPGVSSAIHNIIKKVIIWHNIIIVLLGISSFLTALPLLAIKHMFFLSNVTPLYLCKAFIKTVNNDTISKKGNSIFSYANNNKVIIDNIPTVEKKKIRVQKRFVLSHFSGSVTSLYLVILGFLYWLKFSISRFFNLKLDTYDYIISHMLFVQIIIAKKNK
ncbi:MAG: hypothetical protein DGJ47_001070 [Rickettsiaceae bacterium]